MALIERLMHTDPDAARHIPVHAFFAAMAEINSGNLTAAQVKSFLNTTAADDLELDALIAGVSGGIAAREQYINGIHAVFILSEIDAPGYDSEAAVRTRLGL